MIRYLIKNNIKLMSRSSINILCFVLAPILVSAVLMSAFSTLLEKYEDVGTFTVGYRISGEKAGTYIKEALEKMGGNNDITFSEYPTGTVEDAVNRSDIACFVDFGDETYKIYEKEDYNIQGKITEGIISIFYNSIALGQSSSEAADITVNKADFIPPVDSIDYYGIIEIIYFGWCAIVCAAALFSNEKKYRIRNKYTVSGVSEFKANIMFTISVVLDLLGTFGITIFTVIFGPGLNPNMEISEGFSLLFQRSGGLFVYGPLLMRITALILMIVARVKYPKNTFAKVLMWLYIAFYILYILLIIAVISFFAWFMTQCAAY